MPDMSQAQARQSAIAAGKTPAEVDAFIQQEGGARTSAQRITSAFDVPGSTGTNDLSAFHAQKAAPAGADASARGTYLSGATGGAMGGGGGSVPPSIAALGGGGGGAPTGGMPDSAAGLSTVVDPGMSSVSGLNIGTGGGGATGMSEGDSLAGLLGATTGGLRSLGRRSPAMESTDVAQRGKRVY